MFAAIKLIYPIMATSNNNQNQMTYEKAIALRESGKPLSKKQIWEITDLGYDYYYGKRGKMKRDPEKGVELFTIAAERGDAVAQFDLGLAYDDGVGVEEIDWDKAAYWYERAAKGGETNAMFNLAVLLKMGLVGFGSKENRDREQDKRQAVYWLRKVAKRGEINAISKLGECYFHGEGVRRNRPLGFKMMQQAAEQGYGHAQYNLSLLYLHGDYVEKDFDKEFFWLQKAVENGCPEAYNNLGVCYSLGRGTQIDHDKAFALYKKAIRWTYVNEEAANNLAICYENGEGVEPDPREALRWYRRAKRWGKEGIEEDIERMKHAVK